MTGEDSMRDDCRIRAVFSDVDGTLLNSAHRVTPRTAEWIRKLGEMDIPFIIVSARSPSGIYPIMKRNGFQSALIAYSGALIMDKDRNVLYNRQIPRDLAAGIERFFIEKKRSDIRFDMSWCIYSADDWISPDRSDPIPGGDRRGPCAGRGRQQVPVHLCAGDYSRDREGSKEEFSGSGSSQVQRHPA